MANVENLSTLEKEELLRWFMHWLPMEKRGELMARYPQHYNKMLGKKLLMVKLPSEVVEKGCTITMQGKTYKEGDIVPEHEV